MVRLRRCKQDSCHILIKYDEHFCDIHKHLESDYLSRINKRASRYRYNKYDRQRKADQYAFYRDDTWKHIRLLVLGRDHHICQYCGAINSNTVDHIVPYEYDPTRKLDESNLVTSCRQCHRVKTAWQQAYYGTGKQNELRNVPVIDDIRIVVRLMAKHRC